MKNTSTLAETLEARNAATLEWIAADPTNRWSTLVVTDLAFWASCGITTVEQYDHYMLVSNVFEATRDAYGYKPHWGHLNALSTEQLECQLANLSAAIEASIQEEEKNEDLFTFLEAALIWLDTHEETSNFHLILLLETTKFLGFYPDISDVDAKFFVMNEGFFTPFQGISCLSEHETFLFQKLIALKFDSDQKVFAGIERQILLKILLEYYTIHLDGFKKPKSLEVLKEVFS